MSPLRRAIWGVLAGGVACLVMALATPSTGGLSWALALGAAMVYQHHRVAIWRTPSTVLCAALFSSLLLSFALALIGEPTAGWTWLHGLIWCPSLLAGHLAVQALSRMLPKSSLPIPVGGRLAHRWRQALRASPWSGLKPGPLEPSPTSQHPPGPIHDYGECMHLETGRLPLHREGPVRGMGLRVKWTFDILVTVVLLPLAIPLALLLALLVKIASPGPAFYSQTRVTLGHRPFLIYKIRSMVVDAEPHGQAVWPEEGDPRITSIGKWLRRLWLDELPQLFNVLKGDLSLVGPRPERPAFVEDFTRIWPNYACRHQVKAGLTGLAQVLGFTGNTSIQGRLMGDLHYARRWSPWLDLKILLLTIFRMAFRKQVGEHASEP